jgi:hypothetical protein
MDLKVGIKSTSRIKKNEARPASPPVVPVEAVPMVRIPYYSIIFLLDPWVILQDFTL